MTTPKAFVTLGLLSTGEVAKRLGVHRSTVNHWIRTHQLKATKVGKRYEGVSLQALRESGIQASFAKKKPVAAVPLKESGTATKKRQSVPAPLVSTSTKKKR